VQSEYAVATWKKKQAVPAAPAPKRRSSARKSRITKTIKAKKRS